ncbi:Uncharacterised protein [Legionella waltersii]|nr:Uncharacterised protein [Legionella waltersii]
MKNQVKEVIKSIILSKLKQDKAVWCVPQG